MLRFSDKVVLVTGGTRGIGRDIALRLADEGAILAVTYRGDTTSADRLAQELTERGAQFAVMQSDIAKASDAAGLPDRVVERFGRLDGVINNAGGTHDGAFATMTAQAWTPVLETNLTGTLRISLHAARHLVTSKGSMVMLSSLAGVVGKEGQASYSFTKGGLVGMTRYLARRLGPEGVRVNAVAPGFIETDMVTDLDPSMYQHILRGTALGHMGQPEDVAGAVAYLASSDAAYVSGDVMRVDGGFHR